MMMTQPGYAQSFRDFLAALSGGSSVTDALQHTYGRTLPQIQDDLRKHLQQERFASIKYPYNANPGDTEVAEDQSETNELEVELRLADLQSYNPSAASRAAVRLEELSALYPRSPEVEESLAALALRSGDEAGVVAHMNKAYQRGSKDAELLIVDAQLKMKTGTPEAQIIPLLERAVAEKPDSYRARILLGHLVYRSNDYSRALSLLKPIEDIDDPNAFVVLGSLAYSAVRTGDYSSASRYTIKALKKARSDAERTAMTNLLQWISTRMASSAEADRATGISSSSAGLSNP
ncbi:MAG: hypothetical protein M3Y50_08620 [Acidobacteriota bacterium]|nr:hypothetical protein [Acidobacteriota bacterium]